MKSFSQEGACASIQWPGHEALDLQKNSTPKKNRLIAFHLDSCVFLLLTTISAHLEHYSNIAPFNELRGEKL